MFCGDIQWEASVQVDHKRKMEEDTKTMRRPPSTRGGVPAPTNGELSPDSIHFKTMERFTDFLVYIAGMYTMLVLYLKGIYLTLNSWHPGTTADM